MAHPYWPLFDLEVRTPRTDAPVPRRRTGNAAHRRRIGGGVHVARLHAVLGALDRPGPPEFERQALAFYWRNRAATPESWNILVRGHRRRRGGRFDESGCRRRSRSSGGSRPDRGSVSRITDAGRARSSGSATLHLGFLAFDASVAGTGAYTDNAPSLGVTGRSATNTTASSTTFAAGTRRDRALSDDVEGTSSPNVRRDDIEIAGDGAARELLGITPGRWATSSRQRFAVMPERRHGRPRRSTALSSTLLAGRGAGPRRMEVGGRDRVHHRRVATGLGDDLADELVPRHGAAVGHVVDARPALDGEPSHHRRQVGGEGRAAPLVVDERQAGLFLDEPEDRLDHVVAVGTAHPGGPDDAGVPDRPLALPGEFRRAVDRLRVRVVPLAVRAGRACRRRRSRC